MSDKVKATELKWCNMCAHPNVNGGKSLAFYDTKTKMGPWANLCKSCMERFGMYSPNELGTGKGQEIIYTEKQLLQALAEIDGEQAGRSN